MTSDEVKQLLAKIIEDGEGTTLYLTSNKGMAAPTLAMLLGHIIDRLAAIEERLGGR